jgi:hypothetical protein
MNLKRYNDWLIALGGTAVAGLALLVIGSRLFEMLRPPYRPYASTGIALNGAPDKAARNQLLVFCSPILIPGTDTQLIPVATFSDKDPTAVSSVQYDRSYNMVAHELSRAELSCHAPGAAGEARAFNILVRDGHSNEQRLLLSKPAQVLEIHVPAAACKAEESIIPCDAVLLSIRDEDANKDGILNEDDPSTLYAADLALKSLHRLSPPGATVLGWTWDLRARTLLLRVANEDKERTSTDILATRSPDWPIATPIVAPELRERLTKALQ